MGSNLVKLNMVDGSTVYRFDPPKDPVTVHIKSCLYVFGESTTQVEFDGSMPPPFERITGTNGSSVGYRNTQTRLKGQDVDWVEAGE